MSVTRRDFLKHSAAVSAAFAGLRSFGFLSAQAAEALATQAGFGPLMPDVEKVFDLPEGFTYRVISRIGQTMDDGLLAPGLPDGMGAFAGPDGLTLIVRNHENRYTPRRNGPFGWQNELLDRVDKASLFDPGNEHKPVELGGTTTLVYDTRRQRLVRQYLSLGGTCRNCAGGVTPWGTWVTCEEADDAWGEGLQDGHGYNFEVTPSVEQHMSEPVPLKAMGRFNHEAIAVDPLTGIVYETEDRNEGLIYRFLPNVPGKLREGGRLQALGVIGRPGMDLRNWKEDASEGETLEGQTPSPQVAQGTVLDVRWIDLEEVDPQEDDLRVRGRQAGAAVFARGEGMWHGHDSIYFACTNGGGQKLGQLWRYVPSRFEGQEDEARFPGRLELFSEPNDHNLLVNADNLTIAPWGDLIICEDRGGKEKANLVGLTPRGQFYKFGSYQLSKSELAGACFAPDGSTLFVNAQSDGLTFAITGPWPRA